MSHVAESDLSIAGEWGEATQQLHDFIPVHCYQAQKVKISVLKWLVMKGQNTKCRNSQVAHCFVLEAKLQDIFVAKKKNGLQFI
jgi:hypothetical protein